MTDCIVLGQVTDVHLGPLPRVPLRLLNLKRTTGTLNWHRSRRRVHEMGVADALVSDAWARGAEHIAVTGDLCNIGLPSEYEAALRWLQTVGAPDRVSVIPGNHDIYSSLRGDPGVGRWAPFMTSCGMGAEFGSGATFPYVRVLGSGAVRVALIGLNSAMETPPLIAAGRVGAAQMARLRHALQATREAGLVRVVMIHHPPLPGQAKPDRGLRDAEALRDVLADEGADLVIHGHNHRTMFASLLSRFGAVPVIGAPSSSAAVRHGQEPLGQVHLFTVRQIDKKARISLTVRGLTDPRGAIGTLNERPITQV